MGGKVVPQIGPLLRKGLEMEIQSEGSGCVSKQVKEIASVSWRSSISRRSRKVTVEHTVCGLAKVELTFAR